MVTAIECISADENIGKEHFTALYKPARDSTLTKRNIQAGWAATGLFPFNPKRVFRNTPKPPTQLSVTGANEIAAVPGVQDEVPQTPVTLVTAEALIPLHNLIKEDARALDEVSQRLLQRHVQKLASAARVLFAECALLQDQNQSLIKINKEAKVRWSTRSVVLRKAKVMSYEDLEEARAKRAAKDRTLGKVKGKRGGKGKSPAPEAVTPQPEIDVTRMNVVLEPWRTPVAQMY
ncbi:hypothetical protein EJ02DRAFT_471288 [Clathrospora elynae]|uniref:Uncharacterized protein n=1 Tax=Clathrospora elynae TaxID=706981 RepID=A0A6A5S6U8_9PLEO|nr:hypothetical protein EJ02DRAFT_471288 [Clathrospora elynae]